MTVAAAIAAPAAQADETAFGQVRCKVKAEVRLSEGLRLGIPFQVGTLRTPSPGSVLCSGQLGDRSLAGVEGQIKLSGTFGDGPIGLATGGATCTHNDGYMDAKLILPLSDGVATLKSDGVYWVRSAMAVIKSWGSVGDAPLSLEAVITSRDGSCTEDRPIHLAGFEGVLAAAGNIAYVVERARRQPPLQGRLGRRDRLWRGVER